MKYATKLYTLPLSAKSTAWVEIHVAFKTMNVCKYICFEQASGEKWLQQNFQTKSIRDNIVAMVIEMPKHIKLY